MLLRARTPLPPLLHSEEKIGLEFDGTTAMRWPPDWRLRLADALVARGRNLFFEVQRSPASIRSAAPPTSKLRHRLATFINTLTLTASVTVPSITNLSLTPAEIQTVNSQYT